MLQTLGALINRQVVRGKTVTIQSVEYLSALTVRSYRTLRHTTAFGVEGEITLCASGPQVTQIVGRFGMEAFLLPKSWVREHLVREIIPSRQAASSEISATIAEHQIIATSTNCTQGVVDGQMSIDIDPYPLFFCLDTINVEAIRGVHRERDMFRICQENFRSVESNNKQIGVVMDPDAHSAVKIDVHCTGIDLKTGLDHPASLIAHILVPNSLGVPEVVFVAGGSR